MIKDLHNLSHILRIKFDHSESRHNVGGRERRLRNDTSLIRTTHYENKFLFHTIVYRRRKTERKRVHIKAKDLQGPLRQTLHSFINFSCSSPVF